ncbi:MAG: hypothetical protein N2255_02480, partial [Kiritimatiellae bacterium]|nr:hypothetical protein [Kiritimatiellia bacterium]
RLVLLCVFFFPLGLQILRMHRVLMRVPPGETAPLGTIFLTTLPAFAPVCMAIGLYFPLTCAFLASHSRQDTKAEFSPVVSHVYAAESLGSAVGGAILSFVLLPLSSWLCSILWICGIGTVAASVLTSGRLCKILLALLATGACLLAARPPEWLQTLEHASVQQRWRSIAGPSSDLILSTDTVYQNLALARQGDQFTIYGNGQVMFTFPDPHGTEHKIHFVMAQSPHARKILLLGGNPAADIPELLKYGPDLVVHVELEPQILEVLKIADPGAIASLQADHRVRFLSEDAPRFIRLTPERFDAVIVNAPEPLTISANRFYTLDFFSAVRRILSPTGFVYVSVAGSEQLQAEAALPGASVFRTLKKVFPKVLVTAGAHHAFFAGGTMSTITFDRQELFTRSCEAGVTNLYFRPEYLLVAEEIAPEKVQYVETRLGELRVPENTTMRPVASFYNLFLWSRFSGSKVDRWLRLLYELKVDRLGKGITGTGLGLVLAGALIGGAMRRRAAPQGADRMKIPRQGSRWAMGMLGLLMASTGFLAMSLEVMLIFLFQSLFGYVYAKVGLIVGLFMLGLVCGASTGRHIAIRQRTAWLSLGTFEAVLFALVMALPNIAAGPPGQTPGLSSHFHELLFFLCVVFVGWAVGTEFTLVNRIFCDAGGSVPAAAAISAGSDSLGSALGALLAGILMVPVWGIVGACVLLASLKIAGLLSLVSAALALYLPRH